MGSEIRERANGALMSRWAMGTIAATLVATSLWALSWAAAEDTECEASGGWLSSADGQKR